MEKGKKSKIEHLLWLMRNFTYFSLHYSEVNDLHSSSPFTDREAQTKKS